MIYVNKAEEKFNKAEGLFFFVLVCSSSQASVVVWLLQHLAPAVWAAFLELGFSNRQGLSSRLLSTAQAAAERQPHSFSVLPGPGSCTRNVLCGTFQGPNFCRVCDPSCGWLLQYLEACSTPCSGSFLSFWDPDRYNNQTFWMCSI